ncbi:helix-turn-helix transcriptional regulator [Leifsonia aquatica]|uniref:helix-turn-helix transcriptional regulator n=1 Tax=Leifsonia aquatica TaxID=144185 RepID=UPI001F05F06F|nr:helix-turn-helix transcriptional regulator [Leifsonia aquatica]
MVLDRERRLPRLRALRGRRVRRLPRRLPDGAARMVKPTRVTNRIRVLRFAADEMTQAALADRIGVTRQTVIAIEQGRYSPSLELAFQIARVFGVPLDDVFQYPES